MAKAFASLLLAEAVFAQHFPVQDISKALLSFEDFTSAAVGPLVGMQILPEEDQSGAVVTPAEPEYTSLQDSSSGDGSLSGLEIFYFSLGLVLGITAAFQSTALLSPGGACFAKLMLLLQYFYQTQFYLWESSLDGFAVRRNGIYTIMHMVQYGAVAVWDCTYVYRGFDEGWWQQTALFLNPNSLFMDYLVNGAESFDAKVSKLPVEEIANKLSGVAAGSPSSPRVQGIFDIPIIQYSIVVLTSVIIIAVDFSTVSSLWGQRRFFDSGVFWGMLGVNGLILLLFLFAVAQGLSAVNAQMPAPVAAALLAASSSNSALSSICF